MTKPREAAAEEQKGTILTYTCGSCHQPVRFMANVVALGTESVTHDGNLQPLDSMVCPNGGQHDFGGQLGL